MAENLERTQIALVKSKKWLYPNILSITLFLTEPYKFYPGQYLYIILNDKYKRAFSITSSPTSLPSIELHVHLKEAKEWHPLLYNQVFINRKLIVTQPYGYAFYKESLSFPILFIVGGIAVAPHISIIKYILEKVSDPNLSLIWSVSQKEDLYLNSYLVKLKIAQKLSEYITLVSNQGSLNKDYKLNICEEVFLRFPNLSDYKIFISGSPSMVKVISDAFNKHGLKSKNMFSDALITSGPV